MPSALELLKLKRLENTPGYQQYKRQVNAADLQRGMGYTETPNQEPKYREEAPESFEGGIRQALGTPPPTLNSFDLKSAAPKDPLEDMSDEDRLNYLRQKAVGSDPDALAADTQRFQKIKNSYSR